jgi:NADH dehydrogenase FAD-containing subunit
MIGAIVMKPVQRILIIGGNFAGLTAAKTLGTNHRVTVVDPGSDFEWLPNIHELLSGMKTAAGLRSDRRRLIEACGHRFVRTQIETLDADAGEAWTPAGRCIRFDACIVALGGVNETYGVGGVERHAMPFKSVEQCRRIGIALKRLKSRDGGARITIVGGGLEGVEALGEILRRTRVEDRLSITIVEGGPRLMPDAPAAVDRTIRKHCRRFDVTVWTGRSVTRVNTRSVTLDDRSRLPSDLTIWTGGVRPAPQLHEWGLAPNERSWATVTPALQSTCFDNVFVAGDAAALPSPIAKQAYHALDMGRAAANNLVRHLAGDTLEPFRPSPKPTLLAFGDLDTFMISGTRVIASPALAAVKEAIYQITMASIDPPLAGPAVAALARRATNVIGQLKRADLGPSDLVSLLRLKVD